MLLSKISRLRGGQGQRELDRTCNLLVSERQVPKARFFYGATRIAREAKTHAEIRLFYHSNIEPSTLLARIICSSKDACYICNSFVLMHGKMRDSILAPRHCSFARYGGSENSRSSSSMPLLNCPPACKALHKRGTVRADNEGDTRHHREIR